MSEIQIVADTSMLIENTIRIASDLRQIAVHDVLIGTDICSTIFNHAQTMSACQMVVRNTIDHVSDTSLAVGQIFLQLASASVWVTHPRQFLLDTSIQVNGFQELIADTAQHLEQSFDRYADGKQTIFNVILNEEHEIQT